MLLELWILFAVGSLTLFIVGVLIAKFFDKVLLLSLSIPFMVITTFYSYQIEKVGFGSTSQLTATATYHSLAFFFGGLLLLNIGLLIWFSIIGAAEETGLLKKRGL